MNENAQPFEPSRRKAPPRLRRPSADPPEPDAEVLMTRIVDSEATVADRERFEMLADESADLWRELALRYQHDRELAQQVEQAIAPAVALAAPAAAPDAGPGRAGHRASGRASSAAGDDATNADDRPDAAGRWARPSPRFGWLLPLSGWAAVVVLTVLWVVTANTSHTPLAHELPVVHQPEALTAREHLDAYVRRGIQEGFVMGQMAPTVIEVTEMSDGRVAVHYIRRIEEVEIYDSIDDVPHDDRGILLDR